MKKLPFLLIELLFCCLTTVSVFASLTRIFHTDSAAACEHLMDTASASNCSLGSMKHTAVFAIHHLPCLDQDLRRLATNQYEISGLNHSSWYLLQRREFGKIEPSGILVSFSFETYANEQAEVQALIFEEKDFSLLVVDQPLQDQSLVAMIQKAGCVAGINGGYFQPDGTPLGLLEHYGKMIHPQQRGSILSGFFVSSPEKMTILRVGEEIPASAREVLQAGPFLLDHERPIIGLESTKKACRSFLATSDQGMWVMGIISPVTLDEASHILDALSGVLSEEKKEKKLTRALNLDGGSSSSFWAKTILVPFSFRSDVCVRNYLGVKEKKSSQ